MVGFGSRSFDGVDWVAGAALKADVAQSDTTTAADSNTPIEKHRDNIGNSWMRSTCCTRLDAREISLCG
jgi:hypothetical protein